MKSRILTVKFREPLRDELAQPAASRSRLAKKIGISPQKLDAMLNDEWPYVTRDVIERTADYLNLSVTDVFEFVPVEFWKQIEEKKCTFLRGSQVRNSVQGVDFPISDSDATAELTGFVREFMPNFRYEDHCRDQEELMNRAQSENCIVIGSPKSNTASEILLSRFFDSDPFNSAQKNRLKIPFGFCWPDINPIVEESSLTCSDLARKKTNNRAGIAVRDEADSIHFEADYMPDKEFSEWSTEVGRDCGLVFVANRPFNTNQDVKLIVLAGFSGIGTLGAAKALIKDFRQLEPKKDEKCVFGIVECLYSKPARSETRTFRKFEWSYRKGGNSPITVEEYKATRASKKRKISTEKS